MDPPPSAVSQEALQRHAYLLWEAAGFPPGQSEHFWLMAEQQFTAGGPAVPAPAGKAPAASKRKAPATLPPAAAEAAPVHPTRRKPAAKSSANSAPKVPEDPATAKKAPTKSPRKSPIPPPPEPAPPAAKRPAQSRKPKSGHPG